MIARIAAFIPGESPPEVKIPILFTTIAPHFLFIIPFNSVIEKKNHSLRRFVPDNFRSTARAEIRSMIRIAFISSFSPF
ncbi:MAG TPA: hypothetical protein DEA51_00825 [Erysipelotrichaceae bacterium]|nr:hypothetical protein [Erysipelotrichaceae bacterium]